MIVRWEAGEYEIGVVDGGTVIALIKGTATA